MIPDNPNEIYISSGNPSKSSELKRILISFFPFLDSNIRIRGAKSAEETGSSYLENARIKSFALHRELLNENSTKHLIFSDDSGLEVVGLNFEPGLYSARYAGVHGVSSGFESHMNKVLEKLRSYSELDPARVASMRCALHVLAFENNELREFQAEGHVPGRITTTLGEGHGFGYDPIFYYEPSQKTFGQLSDQEKDKISHRFKAVKGLEKFGEQFRAFLSAH
jgi:XTP/dITP diphosphohydrolase